jgi:hypothetical protein
VSAAQLGNPFQFATSVLINPGNKIFFASFVLNTPLHGSMINSATQTWMMRTKLSLWNEKSGLEFSEPPGNFPVL